MIEDPARPEKIGSELEYKLVYFYEHIVIVYK